MPFNTTTGVYTAPAAATNAIPGKIVASSDWNAIFVDIQNAITALGQRHITLLPRIITTPGDITVAIGDLMILVGATATNIFLPLATTKANPVTIIGNAPGIFSAFNSTVLATPPDTMNTAGGYFLNLDYQVVTFYPQPGGNWSVIKG